MPLVDKWQSGNITNPGTMATTSRYTDLYPGDTSTYELYEQVAGGTSQTVDGTGMKVYDALYTLTTWRATIEATLAFNAGPIHGVTSSIAHWALQYYNGSTWVAIEDADFGRDSVVQISGNLSSLVTSRVRLYLAFFVDGLSAGVDSTRVQISDFRITSSAIVSDACGPLTFTWNAVPGATGYRLKRTDTGAVLYNGPLTTFTISGLVVGDSRTVAVQDYGPFGTGDYSAPITGTQGALPEAVTGFTATMQTDGTVILAWDALTAIPALTAFTVKRDGSTIYTGLLLTFTDTTRDPFVDAAYTIVGTNACGDSTPVEVDSPASTIILTIETDCIADTDTLTWASSSGIEMVNYTLYEQYVAEQNILYSGLLLGYVRARERRYESRVYLLVATSSVDTTFEAIQVSDRCDPRVITNPDPWTPGNQPTQGGWQ